MIAVAVIAVIVYAEFHLGAGHTCTGTAWLPGCGPTSTPASACSAAFVLATGCSPKTPAARHITNPETLKGS